MGENDAVRYLRLHKAVSLGQWDVAKTIFEVDPNAVVGGITKDRETALHLAVASGHSIAFVRKLADFMSEKGKSFNSKLSNGHTVLHYAAVAGNTEAARIIVSKDRSLHMEKDVEGYTPLNLAAQYGHKDTTWFLYSVIQNENPSDFNAVYLLNDLILDDFYDIAIVLLKRYPHLALEKDKFERMALSQLAEKPRAFPSGIQLSRLQHVLYHCSTTNEYGGLKRGDIENPIKKLEQQLQAESKGVLYGFLKDITSTKLKQNQALELLRLLISEILKSDAFNDEDKLGYPLRLAARNGIHEFVTEVIKAYPDSIGLRDKDEHNVFDVAVIYRQEKVYNLLYQMGSCKHFLMGNDVNHETMLHLAARYEPRSRINKISGAALQMQRELQWYKEVEQLVQPSYKKRKNKKNKIPETLFTESHRKLAKQGEDWLKQTAESCTIVATLVVTIVFAAAFTISGSSSDDDDNINSSNTLVYMVYVIFNALALFSSATSVLMFLGILTSRYEEEDFLKELPRRLAIGLITLFVSIASMLVAFSAGLHIVLVHQVHWIAAPIGLLACVPVTLFAFIEFPLLIQIMNSTFGGNIFGKQNDELLI